MLSALTRLEMLEGSISCDDLAFILRSVWVADHARSIVKAGANCQQNIWLHRVGSFNCPVHSQHTQNFLLLAG
jgi:hypothetical protein